MEQARIIKWTILIFTLVSGSVLAECDYGGAAEGYDAVACWGTWDSSLSCSRGYDFDWDTRGRGTSTSTSVGYIKNITILDGYSETVEVIQFRFKFMADDGQVAELKCYNHTASAWVSLGTQAGDELGKVTWYKTISNPGGCLVDGSDFMVDYRVAGSQYYYAYIYESSTNWCIYGDLVPPTITVVTPQNNTNYTWASAGNSLNITFGETANSSSYTLDGGTAISGGAVAEINTTFLLAAGSHNVSVSATDADANTNTTFTQFNISKLPTYVYNYQNGTANSSYTYYRGDDFNLTAVCENSTWSAVLQNNITGNNQSNTSLSAVSILGAWNNSIYPTLDFEMNSTCTGGEDANHSAPVLNRSTLVLDPGIDFYVNSSLATTMYWNFDSNTFNKEAPVGQSASVPSLCANNTNKTGAEQSYNISIILATNSSELYNITIWYNDTVSDSENNTEITNQTYIWFNATGVNDPQCFWLWANNTPGMVAPYGTWSPVIYADTMVT